MTHSEGFPYERALPLRGPSGSNSRGLLDLAGSLTKIHEGWDETGFSGLINFHKLMGTEWFEYEAAFVDGQIVSIKRITERVLAQFYQADFGISEDFDDLPEDELKAWNGESE